MINAIIFSKDRASQLLLLLESIDKHAKGLFNINVLYKSSNDKFEEGYSIVKTAYPNINWLCETSDFKSNVLSLFNDSKYTCFFTDDDVFYQDVSEEMLSKIDEDVFCFSMRLGKNTKKCYTMNATNVLITDKEEDGYIYWNWSKHYLDLGYPLSVDGHIFRTNEIKKMINKTSFHNPNTLEGHLQMFDSLPREKMCAYETSRIVGVPNNRVNDTHPNLHSQEHGMSVDVLNNKLIAGNKIDISKLDFSNIIGCHQEIEYKF